MQLELRRAWHAMALVGLAATAFGVSGLCHLFCAIMLFSPQNYARNMPKICPGLCQNYAIYAKIMLLYQNYAFMLYAKIMPDYAHYARRW